MNDEAQRPLVQPCASASPPAHWPPLQLRVLYPPRQPGAAPAQQRLAAQDLARQVLRQQLGADQTAQWLGLPRAARGAQALSLSHEPGASLLAWCPSGAIGVDIVDLDSLAQACPHELADTAALYLGPDAAAAVAALPVASDARSCFARHWTRLEARLKCLGRELDEWQPARAAALSRTAAVPVHVPGRDGRLCTRWIASVAWRAASPARLMS